VLLLITIMIRTLSDLTYSIVNRYFLILLLNEWLNGLSLDCRSLRAEYVRVELVSLDICMWCVVSRCRWRLGTCWVEVGIRRCSDQEGGEEGMGLGEGVVGRKRACSA